MAGHETTANLLTWTFYLLAQNREVDERLGAAAAAGDGATSGASCAKDCDSIRRHGWSVASPSSASRSSTERSVAPKTTVLFAPLLLHRRARILCRAAALRSGSLADWEPAPFAFFPFGGGARRCIGDEFALREAEIVVAAIARRYSLVKDPAVEVGTAPMVTLRPAGPVPMRPVARSVSPAAV